MAKKKRVCIICGKEYEYCNHCPSKNAIEPWRTLYCSENCREAFKLFGDYKLKKINATEAREQLEMWGLTPEKVKNPHKAFVGDIFENGKVVEIPVLEAEIETEIKEPEIEEPKKKKRQKEEKIVNEN